MERRSERKAVVDLSAESPPSKPMKRKQLLTPKVEVAEEAVEPQVDNETGIDEQKEEELNRIKALTPKGAAEEYNTFKVKSPVLWHLLSVTSYRNLEFLGENRRIPVDLCR